jgi:2-C-methyl-D-erythritol 2,4-cyclodiphosphate synthase
MAETPFRIGIGFDVHPFSDDPGRPIVLGGVTIPGSRGLEGHSDADVLAHAIGDALLGAAACGDLGRHFPDTDPAYRGISSMLLLGRIARIVHERGFRIGNIDTVVMAEEPKIAPHAEAMRSNIAAACGCAPEAIGIKATTTERLGFVGRGEGIAAMATALLERVGR